MAYHSPERKTEEAFVKMLEAQAEDLHGLQIVTRFSNEVLTEPFCQIVCDAAQPWIIGNTVSGDWSCDVSFSIQSHYVKGTDSTAHDEYVANLSDVLMMDALEDKLNLAGEPDFHAILWTPGARRNRVEEHSIITEIEGVLKMMPS